MRFDLKRIESAILAIYFKDLCSKENVTYEDDAIALIAKAAEGSARDGLSLLDQAMTYGTSKVTAAQVREMLGLSDQGLVLDLFDTLMGGDIKASLEKLRYFYGEGADPVRLLEDLLDLTHLLHCIKINTELAQDVTLSSEKRQKVCELAQSLSIPTLTRVWQILLKGFEEARRAPCPQKALEVIVIRLAHLAPLPSVHELLEPFPPSLEKKRLE